MDSPKRRPVSFQDLQAFPEGERWEIIDGEPFLMAAAPRLLHQAVVGSFHASMLVALRGKRCRVYLSPVDVKFTDFNVVQPDLVVICDRAQERETHVEGAPALCVEVLSPSSGRHDRIRKLNLYARMGVPEYWIVSTMPPILEVLVLDGDTYRVAAVHSDVGRFVSPTVPDLDLDLAELFEPVDTSGLEEIRETEPPYLVSR